MSDSPKHKPTLNDDDYVDYSRWSTFFNDVIVFFNNSTIKECLKDLNQELLEREINHD